MALLTLQPLTPELIPAAVQLDQQCLGGLWTADGYQREIDSSNSDLLVLQPVLPTATDPPATAVSSHPHPNPSDPRSALDPHAQQGAEPTSFLTAPPLPIIGLGCVWAIVEEAHITTLAIHPTYRRQGLGQILLFALMAIAHARKLEWATLEVRASNQTAIALYQKFGFETVGSRRKYYQDTGEDALILWRKGLQKPDFQQTLDDWGQAVCDRLHQSNWDVKLSNDLPCIWTFPLDEGARFPSKSFLGKDK